MQDAISSLEKILCTFCGHYRSLPPSASAGRPSKFRKSLSSPHLRVLRGLLLDGVQE